MTNYAQILKRLPSWLYKTAAQLYIDRDFPRHLFIETTASCNLKCPYCPREQIKNHIDFEIFKEIIKEASLYGRRSFSLHLFGEPLLYPRLFEAIRYIKKINSGHTILLTTNGTLIHHFIDEIVLSDITKILWTWRPEAKFTDETKGRLRKWGRFCIRFIKEITPKEALEEWRDWPLREYRNLHNYGGEIDLAKFGSTVQSMGTSRWPCYHLWLAPAVAWNGNILICCSDPHQREILGHFPEMRIHEAWISIRLKEIRKSHLEGKFFGVCKDCDVWKSYPNLFFSWQH